jgi:spermidine/putrescine transport system permease protein
MSGSAAAGVLDHKPRVTGVRLRVGRAAFVIPPLGVVLLLLLGPVVLLALYSLNLRTNVPGTPTDFSADNWKDFLTGVGNPFRGRFFYSMEFTLLVSIATTAAAYPLAYYLAFVARRFRYTLLLLLIAPFFTSYLLRIVAWSDVMLNDNGVVSQVLWALHLRPHGDPVSWLLFSNFSIFLVLFYNWIPFVALPIFAVLENMDHRLIEAATDLGASRFTAFWRVTFPLSLP